MQREIVKLEVNRPVEVALQYSTGKFVRDGQRVMFSLVGGKQVMYLDLGPAQQINELGLKAGESFYVCKRSARDFDCWLSPATERARIQTSTPAAPPEPSELERQLKDSLLLQDARKAEGARANAPAPAGTGTYGPVAVPRSQGMQAWERKLLFQTNALIDVYAQACQHAEAQGVPNAVVRTVMISAFIGLQRQDGR
ncbi:MAG: hypothetical protein WDO73_02840 [Ignavibacteriota bacterium]